MEKEELQRPLPSGVDEAAEEWFKYAKYKSDLSWTPISAFKAGAEWMANQGIIVKGIARPDDKEIWILQELEDIKDGDEVIVQIRKV